MRLVTEQEVFEDVWRGLYGESWKGLICDEAFAHPAKFSRALIRKIYDYVIAEGWAARGDSVVDPFGGVALGGFDAMRHGLNWTGCELEQKFVELGGRNIALWNERYSRMPNWGTARLVQGDSRRLAEVLSAAECCVSSPPFVGCGVEADGRKELLQKAYNASGAKDARPNQVGDYKKHGYVDSYGQTEGQLGAMKEGDHSLVVSSPPYGCDSLHRAVNATREEALPASDRMGKSAWGGGYGTTDGQLANLQADADGYRAAISSPPYEGIRQDGAGTALESGNGFGAYTDEAADLWHTQRDQNNIGNLKTGETFWSASRLILEQLHQVLVPNAHAVFVVKAFVRDKKIVDFPGQWSQLCEAVGFRLLHHHRASLVEHSGTQGGFEEDREIRVERKSFFRRLAESKGSPRIDHESVLCFERS